VLCELFAKTLGLAEVSVDDHFFDLGGHSLLAAKLVPRIRAALGGRCTVTDVLAEPTVAGLIARLDDTKAGGAYEPLLALRVTGNRPPLWCLHPPGGLGWAYAALLPYLDDRPVYALQGADYVAQIRKVQRKGPYHLIGWSTNGTLVSGIADRLRDSGEQCVVPALLDPCGQDDLDIIRSVLAGRRTPIARALFAEITPAPAGRSEVLRQMAELARELDVE
jgi:enterobactin synthetase component F